MTLIDVEMRISSFIERASRQYAGRSILIVTHQGNNVG